MEPIRELPSLPSPLIAFLLCTKCLHTMALNEDYQRAAIILLLLLPLLVPHLTITSLSLVLLPPLSSLFPPHPCSGCTSSYAFLTARFLLGGVWCGLSGQTTALRMCPPLTTKNWTFYQPHVAVGTKGGIVFVVNLNTQTVVKEYAIHSCPVQ